MQNIKQPKIVSYFIYMTFFSKTDSFPQVPHTSVDGLSVHHSTPCFFIIRIREVSTKFHFFPLYNSVSLI